MRHINLNHVTKCTFMNTWLFGGRTYLCTYLSTFRWTLTLPVSALNAILKTSMTIGKKKTTALLKIDCDIYETDVHDWSRCHIGMFMNGTLNRVCLIHPLTCDSDKKQTHPVYRKLNQGNYNTHLNIAAKNFVP